MVMYPLLFSLSLVAYALWRLRNSKSNDLRRQMHSYTLAFVAELRNREASIATILSSSARKSEHTKPSAHNGTRYHSGVIRGLDHASELGRRVMALLSSSIQLVAELRAWQHAAHVLACIDSMLTYHSRTQSDGVDPILEAMVNSIQALLPVPPTGLAQPQADDRERIMDRRVLFDEPHMQTLIWSLKSEDRIAMQEAADRERVHLPLFPAAFLEWEPFDSAEVSEKSKQS